MRRLTNRAPLRQEDGFTLIELLVVVLIIGILSAIAIPAFLGQRQKAQDTSAKSDVNRLAKMVEECRLETTTYADCDEASDLGGAPGLTFAYTAGGVGVLPGATADGYSVFAISEATTGGQNHAFGWIKTGDGRVQRQCVNTAFQPLNAGGCKNSTW